MPAPRYAAQFGRTVDRGIEGGETAFPFIYTFIPKDRDNWERTKDPTLLANFSDVGPIVAAGGQCDVGVTLDADYNFKLLSIKYTVYALDPRGATPYFYWHTSTPNFFLDPMQPMGIVHNRLERKLRINVFWMPQGEYLYGSVNTRTQTTETLPIIPMVIGASQGNEYGPGQFHTPLLLPANGLLRFDIHNDNAESVVVGATIFGLKVRL